MAAALRPWRIACVPRAIRLVSYTRNIASSAQHIVTDSSDPHYTLRDHFDNDSSADALIEHSFSTLKELDPRLVRKLQQRGLTTPTEVQASSIPLGCAGDSLLCQSHTGTGKTLAFGLPLLHQLSQTEPAGRSRGTARPSALVLVPTRELARQVERELEPYASAVGRTMCCMYGGTPYRAQEAALRKGVDMVVATPGAGTAMVYTGSCEYRAHRQAARPSPERQLRLSQVYEALALTCMILCPLSAFSSWS